MAKFGAKPVLSSPVAAKECLDRDLPVVLQGKALEASGWQRPDPLVLLIPAWGNSGSASPDFFLMRFSFGYYPEWPPSVQFINPLTLQYDLSKDGMWLPHIENNQRIAIHKNYRNTGRQLVCSSMTFEYYELEHGGAEAHLWKEGDNFAAALNEILIALHPENGYKGRQQP